MHSINESLLKVNDNVTKIESEVKELDNVCTKASDDSMKLAEAICKTMYLVSVGSENMTNMDTSIRKLVKQIHSLTNQSRLQITLLRKQLILFI